MRKYDLILFDLDGTLTCSGGGILYSVQKTFEAMGKPLLPEEEQRKFIGPPLAFSLERYGFTSKETKEGIEIYKRIYSQKGIYMNEVYDGIPQVLSNLRDKGYFLATATTKIESFARRVMSLFSLTDSFDFISAASSDGTRCSKRDVVLYALDNMQIAPEKAVLVGDTLYDAKGAASTGCSFIGVTYGYGTKEEMLEYYPQALFVDAPSALLDVL